jgi:LemA protein
MNTIWIVLLVVLTLALVLAFVYNSLTKKRIMVREGWSGIGTYLQQRSDLIPNLVESVKGYSLHESNTLQEVIKWRNRGIEAKSTGDKMEADKGMNKALVEFFSLAEQYPDLKANTNFIQLQDSLKEMETSLNQSRRYYNGTVRSYNQSIAVFPNNLIAGMFGFAPETFFQEEVAARELPKVSFTGNG